MGLGTVPNLAVGDAISEAYVDAVTNDVNYFAVAGADLASAASIVPTAEFHKVTGTTTIDNLSPAGPVTGQQVRLWFAGTLTVRNNGGGTGNIRTAGGADLAVKANDLVTFVYDGAVWRVQMHARAGETIVEAENATNTTITATTSGTANTIATCPSFTFDGVTKVRAKFGCYRSDRGSAWVQVGLFEDGTLKGVFIMSSSLTQGISGEMAFTPTAGAKVYSLRAWVDAGSGTIFGGALGGAASPAFLRLLRA